jgi:hypothetical protein
LILQSGLIVGEIEAFWPFGKSGIVGVDSPLEESQSLFGVSDPSLEHAQRRSECEKRENIR